MDIGGTQLFWRAKRLLDVLLSCALLLPLVLLALALLVLNPRLNPGPLFYVQTRVGRNDDLFAMYKFRTMRKGGAQARFADQEIHRITALGHLLRRYRFDELPQIINVLRGEMSLIGPRPEQPEFARRYMETLPGYARRHAIRPGLSGLSQVVQGYTSDTNGTRRKLVLDLRYISECGYRMEIYVLWRTLVTVVTGRGAM